MILGFILPFMCAEKILGLFLLKYYLKYCIFDIKQCKKYTNLFLKFSNISLYAVKMT